MIHMKNYRLGNFPGGESATMIYINIRKQLTVFQYNNGDSLTVWHNNHVNEITV